MSDGRIRIAIEVDGKQVGVASNALGELENSAEQAGDGAKKTERGIKDLVVSLGLVKVGAAAFKLLASSMDTAIQRFDTMNQFPKVMEQVGFGVDSSTDAVERLRDGVTGLPTPLQDVVSTARGIAIMTKDLDGAVDTTLALNNAFLASGSSTDDASRGLTQYLQMLSKGEVDLQSWRTLQETMGLALNEVAESFGYAGEAAQNQLYAALQDGTITFREFNNRMIEMDQAVGGFAERALTGSEGIATSMANIRTAFANGVAGAIEAIDKLSVEITGNNIAQNLDKTKDLAAAAFRAINGAINGSIPYIKAFVGAIEATLPVVQFLSPAILGLVAAYTAFTVISKANALIARNDILLQAAAFSGKALTIVTKGHMTAQVADTKVTVANTVARQAQNGTITVGTAVLGIFTGSIKASTVAMALKTKAVVALNGVLTLLSGPIGWVIGGIALLTAGAVALVKWLNRSTSEGEKLTKQTGELADAAENTASAIDDSSAAYERQQKSIESYAAANDDLVGRIEELSSKENKSATDKQMLAESIEQLNGRVEGLNLAYSEESGAMSLTNEQIRARVDLMKEQEAGTAAQERLLEIAQEQHEVEMQLEETNALREESNRLYEEGDITKREHADAVDELNESEAALEERQKTLRSEYQETETQLSETMDNITEATERNVGNQMILYDTLEEHQKEAVDGMKATWESYKSAATDMFSTISDESEVSVKEMTKNLEENQRIITEWSDNIAKLAERGIDQGLLETLREAGPQSAGHVNALVNASDAELEKLSTAFAEGGDVATDALSTSLGLEGSGVLDAVGHLVTGTEDALKTQIAAADFPGMGGDVADGLAEGIGKTAKNAANESRKMAEQVEDATKDQLDIHSPSRVFRAFGINIPEGLALGITMGSSRAYQAMDALFRQLLQGAKQNIALMTVTAQQLVRPYDVLPQAMQLVGINSMLGLQRGLNMGRGRVMATASSIASEVTATMQRALRINSPSGVMEDDVGHWIPEGVAVGVEKNETVLEKAMQRLSTGMMRYASPEALLGMNRMVPALAGGSSTTQNSYPTTNNYERMLEGAVFHVREESDIPKLAKAIVDYKESMNPNRKPGVRSV